MAVLSTINPTLLDHTKAMDPDGTIAVVAELLNQTNQILMDGVWKESNLATGHQVSIRTGLPAVYWRQLNQGTAPSKSTKAQVVESIGMLEARSEVDIKVAKLNGNERNFRLSEARAFIEGMNQEFATTTFYGNTATQPERFMGLAPRYSDLSAGNAANIIDGGGAAGAINTSVWLVVWGEETVFYVFPKGSSAGLSHRDLGEQTVQQQSVAGAAGGEPLLRMQALTDLFNIDVGLCVKDWRYAVRVANVEVADIDALTNEQAPTNLGNLIHSMRKAVARIPNLSFGRAAWYMNRTVFSGLTGLGLEKSQNAMGVNPGLMQFGRDPQGMMTYMDIPIRLCDGIINTETQVT